MWMCASFLRRLYPPPARFSNDLSPDSGEPATSINLPYVDLHSPRIHDPRFGAIETRRRTTGPQSGRRKTIPTHQCKESRKVKRIVIAFGVAALLTLAAQAQNAPIHWSRNGAP